MTFLELSEIVKKPLRTVTQTFHRKGFSIKKPEDIEAYLHLVLRPHQVRPKQPWRSVAHLTAHQYQPRHAVGSEYFAPLLVHPRRQHTTVGITLTLQASLAGFVSQSFEEAKTLLGLIFTGQKVEGRGESLTCLALYFPRPSHRGESEKTRYAFSQWAEHEGGIEAHFEALTLDALPGTLARDATLREALARGRLEYGWVSLPGM